MSEPVIEVNNLTTAFGDYVVHRNLSLQVNRGEVVGVIGGSGTGKSVLLRAIIGLMPIQAGSIRVLGEEVAGRESPDSKRLERRTGVLFQDGALFSSLTVAQNIQAAVREHYSVPQKLLDEIAALKLSMAGLPPETGSKYPSELSGGMRKRAGLARALALDPELLFLDEPTAGLDPIGASRFDTLIAELRGSLGLTVFLVTHDIDSLIAVSDRVAVLARGQVIATGPVAELANIDDPWLQDYFSGPRGRMARGVSDAGARRREAGTSKEA